LFRLRKKTEKWLAKLLLLLVDDIDIQYKEFKNEERRIVPLPTFYSAPTTLHPQASPSLASRPEMPLQSRARDIMIPPGI